MKRKNAGVPLDEVFSKAEKNPGWKAAYEKAGHEVRLAIQIAKAREKAHLTQKQLAEAIGTTQSAVARIERGAQNLTLQTLSKIADALHADLIVQLR
jgi:DNA-binding XRE family transcriptional regulator